MAWMLPEFIGLPGGMYPPDGGPEGTDMVKLIQKTMPICELHPLTHKGYLGLELFSVEKAWGGSGGGSKQKPTDAATKGSSTKSSDDGGSSGGGGGSETYVDFLKNNGIEVSGSYTKDYLQIVYQDISPFTESFSNAYSQSSLFSDLQNGIGGEGIQELMYVSGGNTEQNLQKLSSEEGFLSSAAKGMLSALQGAEGTINKLAGNQIGSKLKESLINGEKIDLPMLWKSSAYNASYDVTTRLYCPNSANNDLYGSLILAPLGAILALSLPKTTAEDDYSYQWPFLVEFKVPGQAWIKAGYISNVTVVKGGDVNDKSWTGRPNIIDVRFTVNSLFSTMLMALKGEAGNSHQPTLKSELQNMFEKIDIKTGDLDGKYAGYVDGVPDQRSGSGSTEPETKNSAPPVNPVDSNTDRVSDEDEQAYQDLINLSAAFG